MHDAKIIVVDSHPIVREGLRQFLETDDTYKVVAEASNGDEVLGIAENTENDVLMMNAVLPNTNVPKTIQAYKNEYPDHHVVICYIPENIAMIQEFKKSGADGFIGQDAASGEYSAAVHAVLSGGNFFSHNIAALVLKLNQNGASLDNMFGLTSRELEILFMLSNGLCNKEIAREFDLSVRTVETHRMNIRRKTDSNTLSDLVRTAHKLGISNMNAASLVPELFSSELERAS